MFPRVCIGGASGESLDSVQRFEQTRRAMKPVLAAIDMGYGHLRPADALARELDVPVLQMDHPPLADRRDTDFWRRMRELYEPLTRFSQLPAIGPPMRALLNTITAIPPPWPARDLSG